MSGCNRRMNRKKLLVTGGSGFIGTNIIEEAIKKDFEILNIDIKEPKLREHNKIWKNVDINDRAGLQDSIISFQPDYIIHLAARCDLDGKSVNDYKTNVDGVENILYAAKMVKGLKKIIITSSMLVCEPGYTPADQKDYHPTTAYGESKVMTEKIAWTTDLKSDWAIARPTSIWGPFFGTPYREFFDMVINKRYIHIGGNKGRMTYGYVGNAVKQFMAILEADTSKSENRVFYIGDYEPINIEEWADIIAKNKGIKIMTCPYFIIRSAAFFGDVLSKIGISFPLTTFRLNNMVRSNVYSLNETKGIINELPYSVEDGIKETLRWMDENE